MALNDVKYGSRTVLSNVTRLNNTISDTFDVVGEIDNSTLGAAAYQIYMEIPISADYYTGSYDVYLLESQDGADWTGGLDPATVGTDQARVKINDAPWITNFKVNYEGTDRTYAKADFVIDMLGRAPYIAFGVMNHGHFGTDPSATADGYSVSISYSA